MLAVRPHRWRWTLAAAAVLSAAVAGCLRPASADADRKGAAPARTDPIPPRDANVVAVRTFVFPDPWLSFDPEGDPDPEGFRVTVVLESGVKPKGVFGDGKIVISLYRLVPQVGGTAKREQVYEWSFTPEQALAFLSRNPRVFGWGYGFRLSWGKTDVYGQDVQIVVRFIKPDGTVINGSPLTLRVPARSVG